MVKSKFELVEQLVPQNKEINGEIDVLIGADFYWSLMTDDIIRLDDRLVAIRSKLGYMLSGFIADDEKVNNSSNCVHVLNVDVNNDNLMSMEENISLSEKVENFWNLDTLGIVNNEKSVYDINEVKVVDGRYELSLPFKNYHPIIGDNYSHCVKRLKSMKGKLNKSPLLLKRYNDIIMSQCREGIVEQVDDKIDIPEVGKIAYLPHRAVINEGKSSTKIRIVYDASAKTGSCSLNDCLYKGPCLTPLIFGSLLRFRLRNVGIVADIESAYLQISVTPEHRNFLRFLWFGNIDDNESEIIKYRFKRVIFGAAPSQYLLNTVIRKHADRYGESDPEFVKQIKTGFYVDDLVISVTDARDGIDFYTKCKVRFAEASFNVRKWRTNDPE